MHEAIYLNYAATSQKKPQCVIDEVCQYLQKNNETTVHRSLLGMEEAMEVLTVRERIADFFNVSAANHVIFTSGITMSLNMVLNGLLKTGDHVITTSVEHNAVSRPLNRLLKEKQIGYTVIPCLADGSLLPEQVEEAVRPNTKAIVMTQASNVLGTILPVKECFETAKKKGLVTVLDSAQSAGFLPIDMKALAADVVTFTGHKGLLGLSGIGGFALSEEAAERIDPWMVGGTGSRSQDVNQPLFLPDKFEAGTQNILGIISLGSSIRWLQEKDLGMIRHREENLTEQFLRGLAELPVNVLGTKQAERSAPVVSLTSRALPPGQLTQRLYDEYRIITRCGLHCAPWAHQTAGTLDSGAVRFSFGWATKDAEISCALGALKKILT